MDSATAKVIMDGLKPIAAIAGIVAVEITALYLGHNGVILSGVVAVLGGLGGYTLAKNRYAL